MKLVSSSIWSNISPRGSALRRTVFGTALALLLGGCANVPSKYEHADIIDKQVHRGSEVLDFDDTSSTLVSGGWEGELALWSMPKGSPDVIWQGHEGPVHGLGFAGRWIVSAGQDGWIKVWDQHAQLHREKDTGIAVERAAVSENWVVSGHRDGSGRVWSLPELVLKIELQLHKGDVRAVAIHPGNTRFGFGRT